MILCLLCPKEFERPRQMKMHLHWHNPEKRARWQSNLSNKTEKHHVGHGLRGIERPLWIMADDKWRPKPSLALAYVLGILKGDGSVTIWRRRSGYWAYMIQLSTTSESFASSFLLALKEIGLHPRRIYVTGNTSSGNTIYGVFCAGMLFIQWYKSLGLEGILEELKDVDYKVAFLRGFYESEGCATTNNGYLSVGFSSRSGELIKCVQALLGNLGFHPNLSCSLRERDSKYEYTLRLTRSAEGASFLGRVKPCIKNDSKGLRIAE